MRQRMEVAREAILSAGSLLRETFGREISGQVEEKDRNDFVTQSDWLSEKMISETLLRAFPNIGILGEESAEHMHTDEFWIIDPLDGTTNFIHGYPSIGVSIALVKENEVVLGLVFDPLRQELFEAARGGGAFCNEREIHVSGAESLQESLLGTGFPFKAEKHLERYIESFRELFSSCRGVRRSGAAVLDLSHVASGRLDGFWELHLKPWDMAAGALLVLEAGGLVTDFFGGGSFLSAGNIVAGNPGIHGKILEITRRVFHREELAELACDLIDM